MIKHARRIVWSVERKEVGYVWQEVTAHDVLWSHACVLAG